VLDAGRARHGRGDNSAPVSAQLVHHPRQPRQAAAVPLPQAHQRHLPGRGVLW